MQSIRSVLTNLLKQGESSVRDARPVFTTSRRNYSVAVSNSVRDNQAIGGRRNGVNSYLTVRSILYPVGVMPSCQQKSCWSPPPAAYGSPGWSLTTCCPPHSPPLTVSPVSTLIL